MSTVDALDPYIVYMTEYSKSGIGKISVHGNGMGAPTPEMIEKRAREIALINERHPNEYTDGDWDQARRELLDLDEVAAADDADAVADSMSERDSVPGESGHRAARTEDWRMMTKASARIS